MGMHCACVIKERAQQNTFSDSAYIHWYIRPHWAQLWRQRLPSLCTASLRNFLGGQETPLPEVLRCPWVSCSWAIEQFEDNPSWFLGCTIHANETHEHIWKKYLVSFRNSVKRANSEVLRTRFRDGKNRPLEMCSGRNTSHTLSCIFWTADESWHHYRRFFLTVIKSSYDIFLN